MTIANYKHLSSNLRYIQIIQLIQKTVISERRHHTMNSVWKNIGSYRFWFICSLKILIQIRCLSYSVDCTRTILQFNNKTKRNWKLEMWRLWFTDLARSLEMRSVSLHEIMRRDVFHCFTCRHGYCSTTGGFAQRSWISHSRRRLRLGAFNLPEVYICVYISARVFSESAS